MKKRGILHPDLAKVIASMGHTDTLVIADVGLPIPAGVPRIDLAVVEGVPGFLPVLDAVAGELEVEALTMASELQAANPGLAAEILGRFPGADASTVDHERFKAMTAGARAIVRTGETSPYANVILASGVTF